MERVMGIEPTLVAWEATVLPLNYTRCVEPSGNPTIAQTQIASHSSHRPTLIECFDQFPMMLGDFLPFDLHGRRHQTVLNTPGLQ